MKLLIKLANLFCKLTGRIHLLFGCCPWCNSSAPELYDCPVCHYNTKFPPTTETKRKWWTEFTRILKEKENA